MLTRHGRNEYIFPHCDGDTMRAVDLLLYSVGPYTTNNDQELDRDLFSAKSDFLPHPRVHRMFHNVHDVVCCDYYPSIIIFSVYHIENIRCNAHSWWSMAPTSDPELYRKTALYGAYVTFMVGRSSMFLLFLGILHFTSKDTKYDYPRFIKWCYLILAVLVPMMLIGWSTYDRWISYDEDLFQVRRYLDHANTVTLCLFSTVLFCRVLVRVSWNQLRQDRTSPMNACHDKDTEERVKKLLDLITKYTILTLAVVIFAVIVIVMDEMTWSLVS